MLLLKLRVGVFFHARATLSLIVLFDREVFRFSRQDLARVRLLLKHRAVEVVILLSNNRFFHFRNCDSGAEVRRAGLSDGDAAMLHQDLGPLFQLLAD